MRRDAVHAWRSIARKPLLAATVVVSLAAGIGVNIVVFAWLEARVFTPLPGVREAARLHLVEPRITDTGVYPSASWLEYQDLRQQLSTFEALIAFRMAPMYVGDPGRIERVYGQFVSANFFDGLALEPALGRYFRADEVSVAGAARVAVISYGFWQSTYGGAGDVTSQQVRINGVPLAIVGVTPAAFQGPVLGLNFEVWVPATLSPTLQPGSRELDDRRARAYALMGQLGPGVTRQHAQQQAEAAMMRLARDFPESNAGIGVEVLPFWETPRGPQKLLAQALVALQAIMLLLLLAVCGNLTTLMLSRASEREREMSVRTALGASRGRIIRLVLSESLTLGVLGALAGAALAVWGTRAVWTLPTSGLPLRFDSGVTGWGIGAAVLLGLGAGLIFGAAPALRLARLQPAVALRTGAGIAGPGRLGRLLMGGQVALAMVVLIIAAVFLRQFAGTREMDPGFDRAGVLLMAYDFDGVSDDPARASAFATRLLDRVRRLPGVAHAAIALSVPLDIHGMPSRAFAVEGHARTTGGVDRALSNIVTAGYLDAMDIPLLEGRDFAAIDDPAAPPQAIVNQTFVDQYLPDLEPVGRRLEMRGRSFVIAGVARDSVYDAFDEPPTAMVYVSFRDEPLSAGELHLRTTPGHEHDLGGSVRRLVAELSPDVPVFNVRTLVEHIDSNLFFVRVPAQLFGLLGPLLLVLVSIGIYALVAHTTRVRTTEIGIRLALGARPSTVVAGFVLESVGVIATGALVGWSVALLATAALAPEQLSLVVFAGVPTLMLVVGAAASWLPAFRAARLDPMSTLRDSG